MITERSEDTETGERTIEKARELFVDPEGRRETAIGRLALRAASVMQEIYKSSGRFDQMSPETRAWLEKGMVQTSIFDLESTLARILLAETQTRRFDHKFFGQIHPQGSEIGILSNLVAAFMNTNTIIKEVSMAENEMEVKVLSWFAEKFGYDTEQYSGNVVTGGTLANLAALWVARDWKMEELKKNNQWHSGKKLYVLASDMAHYSLDKACFVLGTGNVELIKVPNVLLKTSAKDLRNRACTLDLENGAIMAVIGLAGETETGMVDDLNSLANVAEEFHAHFHVDAAYGGPFILSSAGDRFAGIGRADSITVDPHKMLYTPYSAGIVLFKDHKRHELIDRAMKENAGYQVSEENRKKVDLSNRKNLNFGFSRVEGSMGSGGVISTWATIELLGDKGIAALLNHNIDLTNYAYNRVCRSTFLKPLHEPETNTLLIGLREALSPILHRSVIEIAKARTEAEKAYYISTDDKIFPGVPIYRFIAMNPHSTKENVEELFTTLEKNIAQLLDKQ